MRSAPRSEVDGRKRIAANLVLAILYFCVAWTSGFFVVEPDHITIFSPTHGVALAAVLAWGPWLGFGVFLGALISNLLFLPNLTPALACVLSGGAALQALFGRWLLRRFVGELPPPTVAKTLRALGLQALACTLLPLVGVSALAAAGRVPWERWAGALLQGWTGNYVGMLVVASPLVVAIARMRRERIAEPLLWPLASLFVGFALLSFFMSATYRDREVATRLAADADESIHAIRQRMERNREALIALQGLFAAAQGIEQKEFEIFARPLLARLPAVWSFAWLPRVPAGQRAEAERQLREAGMREPRIFELDAARQKVPAGERDDYFPITLLYPFETLREALGYDEASDPARREAIRQAGDTASEVLTSPLHLLQSTRPGRDLMLFAPVFRAAQPPPESTARRQALEGVVLAVFRLDQLVEGALGELTPHDLDLYLFDVTPTEEKFLAYHPSSVGSATEEPVALDRRTLESGVFFATDFDLLGRRWRAIARPSPAYVRAVRGSGPPIRLALGLLSAALFLFYSHARQRAEERVRAAEVRFRTLVEQSPAIVYLDEVGGRWRYLSPRIGPILGYEPEDLLSGKVRWLDCIAEEDRGMVRERTRANLHEGATIRLDYRMTKRSGELVWIRDEAEATREPGTGAWLLRGVVTDITESKRSELERQALLQITEGLTALGDSRTFLALVRQELGKVLSFEGFSVLLHDSAGDRFVPAFEDLRGDDRIDDPVALSRGLAAYVFRLGAPLLVDRDRFARLLAAGEVETVGHPATSWIGAPLLGRDRSLGVLAVQRYEAERPYTERDLAFVASVASQVAVALERQRGEEALRASEARYRLVTDNLAETVWTFDPATLHFTYVSPSIERLRGYSAEEVMGQRFEEIFSPTSLDKARSLLAQVGPTAGQGPSIEELEQLRRDGSVVLTEVTASSALDDHGRLQLVGVSRDITARKKAELALQATQQSLELAQSVARLGSWELDLATGIGAWSREMFHIFGFEPAAGTPPLAEFMEKIAPPDRSRLLAAQDEAIRTGKPVTVEYSVDLGGGDEAHLEAQIFAILGPDGAPQRTVGTALDITHRRRAELEQRRMQAELLENEARLLEAQRIAHLGVWELDLTRNHLTWSDEIYRIFGVAPQSFAATYETFLEHVHPDDREMVNSAYTRSLATRAPYEIDHRVLREDGSLRIVHERCETWFDDNGMPLRSVGTVQDVTESRLATEQIRQLSRVVEQMDDMVIITDVHGTIEYVNPAFERQLGYSRQEVLGSNPRLFKSGLEAPELYERLWSTVLRGETYQGEIRNRRRDGQIIHEAKTITPIRDEDGRIVRFVATGRDITSRKQMEHDLRERLKELTGLRQTQRLLEADPPPEAVCREIVALLPPAMQFPEATAVSVSFDDLDFGERHGSPGGERELSAPIVAGGRTRGRLAVWYREPLPFILPEEQTLVTGIAQSLSLWFDRRESAAVVRASEQRHRRIFEAAGTGLWEEDFSGVWEVLDRIRESGVSDLRQHLIEHPEIVEEALRSVRVLRVNRAVLKTHQIESLDDPTVFERVFAGVDLDVFRDEMVAMGEGCTHFEAETTGRAMDGSRIDVLLALTIPESRTDPVVLSTVDLTESKRAAAALRSAEALYQTVFDVSLDGLAVFDGESRVVLGNRRAAEIRGLARPEQLVGTPISELVAPSDRERLAGELRRQIASGVVAGEYVAQRCDGNTFPAEFAIVRLPPGEGGRDGIMVGVMRDITARKVAQEALAAERASLARRVEERTADLSRVNAELAQAVRAKDEFLANMSHELRTPLNAILALSESLLEQLRGPLNDRQQASLRTIEASGRHLLALITDILDLSKIEAGRLDLDLQTTSVAEVCEASLLLVREAAAKKGLHLGLSLDDHLARMTVDPRRLKQMLVNLLSNAVKFTEPGGRVRLAVHLDAAAETAAFEVEDTGVGIAPEQLARLFQPFTQLDSSLSRQHEGTGLGLALVRRLSELHGGSVSVESEPQAGSRFTVTLPYRRVTESTHAAGRDGGMTPRHAGVEPHSALIVEDSESAASQLAHYLRELGVRSVIHPQGEGALDLALSLRPDVIFLDLLLPGESGWEVLEKLQADQRTRSIPVVIASVVDDRARALAAGAIASLVKPISRDEVREALRVAVAEPDGREALILVPPATAEAARGRRILLAEDNEINIAAIGEYLVDKGYELVVARNGREALEAAERQPPDLVLMDIQMPEMDGLEATRELRARHATARTPIVALTALAMPGDRERCLAAGADEYLTKPVSLRQMVGLIEELLAR